MPIVVQCGCGAVLRAPDTLAGQTASCPTCMATHKLPRKPTAAANMPRRAGTGRIIYFLLLIALVPLGYELVRANVQTAQAEADRAHVQSLLGRSEVAQALSARGLSPQEIEGRLAELSAEDLRSLAANVEQVQAAGDVPGYIWILIAIILGLVIIGAIAKAD